MQFGRLVDVGLYAACRNEESGDAQLYRRANLRQDNKTPALSVGLPAGGS